MATKWDFGQENQATATVEVVRLSAFTREKARFISHRTSETTLYRIDYASQGSYIFKHL